MFKKLLLKIFKTNSEKEVDGITIVLKRFAKDIIRPNLPTILVAIFFMSIFAASNAGLAWIIKPIINNVFVDKQANTIMYIGLGVIGITLIKSISQYIYTILLFIVSVKVMATARRSLYKVFMEQDIPFHHKNSPGSLVSVTMNELNAMNTLATDIPINVGRDLFTFLGLLGLMFYQNYLYATFIVASVFIIIIPVRIIGKKVKGSFSKTNAGLGALTSQLEQTLNGIREVKSYNKEIREQQRTEVIIQGLMKQQTKINRVSSILPPMMEVFGGISIGIVLIYAGYQVVYHGADAGTFFSFVAALLIAYQPLKRLSEFTVKIQLGALSVKRYYSFLDSEPQIKEIENPVELSIKKADIEFKDITFTYENSGKDEKVKAIDNMNFKIEAGQKIALVGRSGGGKSTIINLIERFYDPEKGKVLIDNQDIKEVSIKSLRENISLVSQEVTLFDDSILNNISYSKEDASKEEIEIAAKNASCLDFINNFSQGFETLIGPRGARLSGGQRQRVSIARALLKDAPILLLDEATSALDTESEKAIQNALDVLMKNKTTIIIAHRLSTIINCDKIFVIDAGKIIESGNHNELIQNEDSFYKYLYDLQFKQQEEIMQ
jgi:subfamily B ATP-binding cassette protein MsbA